MKIPFLNNVRSGLATNSSSSHSLVFHPNPVADNDLSSAAHTDTEFGWDHFVLDSLGSKLMYALTQAVGGSLGWKERMTPEKVESLKSEWGHLFPEFQDDDFAWAAAAGGYVDHQSSIQVTPEFMGKVRDPRVVIHGGNDNGGYPYIDRVYDETTGDYRDEDRDLPPGATREVLG